MLLSGALYASASLLGSASFSIAWQPAPPAERLARLDLAARLFPLSPLIRRGPALAVMLAPESYAPRIAARAIVRAIRGDPRAPDLWRALVTLRLHSGDDRGAAAALAILQRLAPQAPAVRAALAQPPPTTGVIDK